MHISPRLTAFAFILTSIVPVQVDAVDAPPVVSTAEPYEQDFVLTAYYSPLPDQCCYVKGNLEADKILNGNGTHGADGTQVYPGMLAAPPSYAFGTRIALPGLGTMTVHDRGGAIQEQGTVHRLDVWAGHGEEGLARALAFGVQRIRGTVYPMGSQQPAESIDLAALPAPIERLKPYFVADAGIVSVHPSFGERGLAVNLLQENLKTIGYFDHEVTGMFGEVTKVALGAFVADMHLEEPSDELTRVTAAHLQAAQDVLLRESPVPFIAPDSSIDDIQKAQRLLRHLGHYRGRTNGIYSETLAQAVIAYQQSVGLIADASSPGAGRIGPMTKGKLDLEWKRGRIEARAKQILLLDDIRTLLVNKNMLVNAFLDQGANGAAVKTVQQLLASIGFFPEDMVNGNYGPLTAQAIASYQVARGLLGSTSEKGAGTVGPITLRMLKQEQVRSMYRLVRAQGLQVL